MRYFLLVLLLLIFLPTNIVFACSGPMQNLDGTAESSTIIVRARIVSSDERQENAIIQVETYFKGTGGEYLLLVGNTRGLSNGLIQGRYGRGDCNGRNPYMLEGETYYLFLREGIAGAYDFTNTVFGYSVFHFSEEDSTERAYLNDEFQDINESQLLEILAEQNHGSSEPIPNEIPSPATLRITTESGADYLLPVDGSAPFPLTSELYIAIHNNTLFYRLDNEFLAICGEALDCFRFSPSLIDLVIQAPENQILLGNGESFAGQGFIFSPTSDYLAIWGEESIEIYAMPYYWRFDGNNIWETSLVKELQIASPNHLAWSPDGRLLAYSDSEGLWLWDVFTENAAPRLLMAAEENLPYAKEFSPLGRYLAVQNGDEASYLDLISGQSLPDGVFSPDERFMIAYIRNETPSTAQFCTLAPFECSGSMSMTTEVLWRDNQGFYVMWCAMSEVTSCDLYSEEFPYIRGYTYPQDPENPDYTPVRLFAYEAENDLLATVRGEYMLNERDLSTYLDSPIAKIEWLPSFFYHEN